MLVITFEVPGRAFGYDRDSAVYRRTSKELAAFRRAVQICYLEALRKDPDARRFPQVENGTYTGAVGLFAKVYGSCLDWDNAGKEISDALELNRKSAGCGAMKNDRQVIAGYVTFPDRFLTDKGGIERSSLEPPRVEVRLVFYDC